MKRGNEVSVGVLITVAVVVLVLGTLWLVRGGLKNGYPLYTEFTWGQNLKQGQPVLLAGVSVGTVGDVTLLQRNGQQQGRLGVLLRIEDKYKIPKGSLATVKAVGIFGDVAVAITPPAKMTPASYNPGDTIPPGTPSADIDLILSRVDSIGASLSVLTKALQTQVIEAGTLKNANKLVASMADASALLRGILVEQNKNFTATMESFRESAAHVSRAVDSVQIRAAVDSLRLVASNTQKFVTNLDSTNAQVQRLIAQIQNPNGTVGKFLTDSLLYRDLRHTLIQADSLLEDFRKNPKKYINVHVF